MFERYQHDTNYIKARHAERERDLTGVRNRVQANSHGVKERMFSLLGDVLITWGQKLKGDLEINELSNDCA